MSGRAITVSICVLPMIGCAVATSAFTATRARPFDFETVTKVVDKGHAPHAGKIERKPDLLGAEIVEQLAKCWRDEPTRSGHPFDDFIPVFRIALNRNGTFARDPQILNPPTTAAMQANAISGKAALLRFQPLHLSKSSMEGVPEPYERTIRFDPH